MSIWEEHKSELFIIVWVVSGIALGIIVVLGYHVLPGIFRPILLNWSSLKLTIYSCVIAAIPASGAVLYVLDQKKKRLRDEAIKEENRNALEFYKKCQARNISSIESESDRKNIRLIASSYGLLAYNDAERMFYDGKIQFENELKMKSQKKFDKSREEDLREYEINKYRADINGKLKYCNTATAEYNLAKLKLRSSERIEEPYLKSQMEVKAHKQNSALWGGIADGIAGPVAGIATAMSVQQKNAEAEERAARIRENARNQLERHEEDMKIVNRTARESRRGIYLVEDKLCDINDVSEKYKALNISVTSIEIKDNKNFVVNASVDVNKEFELMGSKAYLDGSLKVEMYNRENKLVGEGFYCAPGFDCPNTSRVGFLQERDIKVLCINEHNIDIDDTRLLRCEFSPCHLWIIEG